LPWRTSAWRRRSWLGKDCRGRRQPQSKPVPAFANSFLCRSARHHRTKHAFLGSSNSSRAPNFLLPNTSHHPENISSQGPVRECSAPSAVLNSSKLFKNTTMICRYRSSDGPGSRLAASSCQSKFSTAKEPTAQEANDFSESGLPCCRAVYSKLARVFQQAAQRRQPQPLLCPESTVENEELECLIASSPEEF
jgi:hypothetical protein